MKDNSGYTNWETERMMDHALTYYKTKKQWNFERMVNELRYFELKIHAEGLKHFTLYLEDPVNYWEIYGRLAQKELYK